MTDLFGKYMYMYMADLHKITELTEAYLYSPGATATEQSRHFPGASVWEEELGSHPDRELVTWVVEGITCCFRIGFNFSSQIGTSTAQNKRSASIHISRFGVIPKPHQPGKWRLITDLSSLIWHP